MRGLKFVTIACALFAGQASADNFKECLNSSIISDSMIDACLALIKSNHYKGHTLSMIYNNLGVSYANQGERDDAVKAQMKAIRIDPKHILPRVNVARNLVGLGRLEEAQEAISGAIKLAPGEAEYYILRGDVNERLNRLEDALADYDAAIKRRPKSVDTYQKRGSVLRQLSRYPEAITDFSRAIELNPRNPAPYYARGLAWTESGRCDKAIEDYTATIERSPRYSGAYNNRGVCLNRAGKREEARADFEKALALDPGNIEAQQNLRLPKPPSSVEAVPIAPTLTVPDSALPPPIDPKIIEQLKAPEFERLPDVREIELEKN